MDDRPDAPEVRPPTLHDLARIGRAFAAEGVRAILIGGLAVLLQGGERTTKDIDFLVDPAPDNVERAKRALMTLEDGAARELDARDLERYAVVRVADEVMVDLLASACGVTYASAEAKADVFQVEGVAIRVADKRTLIETKRTIRPSDAADRAWLEALLEAEA